MDMSIKTFADLTGVSVRTLHYYDHIGLLKPDRMDPRTGYRTYGDIALARMQEILFYRELDFPLKAIGAMLSSPHYDKQQALGQQKQLLQLKIQRLQRIVTALERAEKGDTMTDFTPFDSGDIDAYKAEAKRRWGHTAAYQESTQKDTPAEDMAAGLDEIFIAFAAAKAADIPADGEEAQTLCRQLQQFITHTQYTCTQEMLGCLGQMYVADPRFMQNIDRHRPGTAAYAATAIAAYCRK